MKLIYSLLIMLITSNLAFGQGGMDALPSNPEPGKCYAKCIEPDEYKEEVFTVKIKPEYTKLEVIPAEYKSVDEEIIVKPKSKKYTYVPATYKDVYDTIWTKDTYNKLSVLPAEFKPNIETVEVKSKYGKWVAGEKDPDCPSINPEDCRVFYYREYDAVKKDIPIENKQKDETTSAKEITGKYVVEKRQVEVTPARYDEEIIPAIKKTISKQVLVNDESTKKEQLPAEYKEVTRQVLVKAGGMSVWREVPCTLPEQGVVLPIVWSVGSSTLTDQAKRIIDEKLIKEADKKKGSYIEVGSHTDARGGNQSNQSLSEKRAKSVAEYMITKGIEKDRIIAVGYGESRLKNDCADGVQCSDAEHAANRRTEFKLF